MSQIKVDEQRSYAVSIGTLPEPDAIGITSSTISN